MESLSYKILKLPLLYVPTTQFHFFKLKNSLFQLMEHVICRFLISYLISNMEKEVLGFLADLVYVPDLSWKIYFFCKNLNHSIKSFLFKGFVIAVLTIKLTNIRRGMVLHFSKNFQYRLLVEDFFSNKCDA